MIRRRSTVHAMFVWQGFLTRGGSNVNWTDEDDGLYGSQIGAAMRVSDAVVILAEELDVFWTMRPQVCFPGVFDYEVSETLGVWLRNHRHASMKAVRIRARDLIARFFANSGPA